MNQNTQSLQDYLLSQEVDITVHKIEITLDEESLHRAAKAWTAEEDGIRAVIENRMQKIREEILLRATPYELLVMREALVELAHVFDDFNMCAKEIERRAKEKEGDEEVEEVSPVEEPVQEQSSM